jgi:hypothetical protein
MIQINEQERVELVKFVLRHASTSFTTLKEQLSMFLDCFFSIIKNHHDREKSEIASYADVFFQMMASKCLHMKLLLNGVSYSSSKGISMDNIIDPTIITPLVRMMYEQAGLFNLIYRNAANEDERIIIYNLWMVSGLNYRQSFTDVITLDENKAKAQTESDEIKRYTKIIKGTTLYKSLPPKEQSKIETRINTKNYLVQIKNQKVDVLDWKKLNDILKLDVRLFSHFYAHASLYTHPNYVSAMQFSQMFSDERDYMGLAELAITNGLAILSIFLADYLHYYPEALQTFNNLPLGDQIVINMRNKVSRGAPYSINDAGDAMGNI